MKIKYNVLGFLLFFTAYISAVSYVTVNIEINGSKITVELVTESNLRTKTTIKTVGVDTIKDALFKISNESIHFKYDNQGTNYNALINSITDSEKQIAVRKAFTEFQNYVVNNIRSVVADQSKLNAKVDIDSNSPIVAANKDVYKHVMNLGKVLGIAMPDPDYSFFKKWILGRALPLTILAIGGYATVRYWNQIPSIGDVGTKVKGSGEAMIGFDKWLKTPRPKTPTTPSAAPKTELSAPTVNPPATPSTPPITSAPPIEIAPMPIPTPPLEILPILPKSPTMLPTDLNPSPPSVDLTPPIPPTEL